MCIVTIQENLAENGIYFTLSEISLLQFNVKEGR